MKTGKDAGATALRLREAKEGAQVDESDLFLTIVEYRSRCMAILRIKNLPDELYKKLQAQAKREHRSVVEEVTHLLTEALEPAKPLSVLELQGLGKEHWKNINAGKHVARERASWD